MNFFERIKKNGKEKIGIEKKRFEQKKIRCASNMILILAQARINNEKRQTMGRLQ